MARTHWCGRQVFTAADYRVSREADRMGIRFEGPTIEHAVSVDKGGADIISDGIGPGAIQVPGAGLPIVLLADRQTVGGYAKIATVASVDGRSPSGALGGTTTLN